MIKTKMINLWKFIKVKFMREEENQTYHLTRENGPIDYIACAISAVIIFVYYYKYAFTIMSDQIHTDLLFHSEFAENFYLKKDLFLEAWIRVPYMFWHLITKFIESRLDFPMSDATSMTYSLFGLFSFAVMTFFIYKVVKYYTQKMSLSLAAFGALILAFVSPYAKWWFTPNIYLGQFGVNPFHNPTHMAVKSFGLLASMAGIDIIKNLRGEKLMFFKNAKGLYVWFGVLLLMTTFTKPTYMYMLLPAGFVYIVGLLIYNMIKAKEKVVDALKTLLYTSLATIPSLILIIFEYLAFYRWGNQYPSKVIIGPFLETWHMFSYDVPTSIILAMFFPIWMMVTNPGYFLKSTEGLLSVICYVVGTFEFAFFEEDGGKKSSANFAWCMMAGMTILFTTCVSKLIQNTMAKKEGALHAIYIIVSWFFLFLHVYSGITILEDVIVRHIR